MLFTGLSWRLVCAHPLLRLNVHPGISFLLLEFAQRLRLRLRLRFRLRFRLGASVVPAITNRLLVNVALEVDVGGFAATQRIVVHRGEEQANETVPKRPQLIQRRCEAAEP